MNRLQALFCVCLFASALRAEDAPIRFEDVSQAAGTLMQPRAKHPDVKIREGQANFQNVYEKGYCNQPSDVIFVDLNGDGHLDLFMLNTPHNLWSRLWLGDGKGGFAEVHPSKLAPHPPQFTYYHMLAFSFLGTAQQDLVMTTPYNGWDYHHYASERFRHFVTDPNKPEGVYVSRFGLGTHGITQLMTDFDGDGVVDFATGIGFDRGNITGESVVACGTLSDGEWRLDGSEIPASVGCQAVAADFWGDGRPGILARGHWTSAKLLRNSGKRHFIDTTAGSGLENMPSGGPIAVADFNNDGKLDIFCTGCAAGGKPGVPKLYLNQGNGVFKDATEGSGLIPEGKKEFKEQFGSALAADFDNDGLVDIFVCDGDVNRLYHNLGGGRFKELSAPAGISIAPAKESPNTCGDYDHDGRVDLAYISAERGVTLLHNVSANANGWVNVVLKGTPGNPEAAGARVTVFRAGSLGDPAAILGYQEKIFATEFRMPNPLHFGLGAADKCDIQAAFPGGKKVEKRGVAAKSAVTIESGEQDK